MCILVLFGTLSSMTLVTSSSPRQVTVPSNCLISTLWNKGNSTDLTLTLWMDFTSNLSLTSSWVDQPTELCLSGTWELASLCKPSMVTWMLLMTQSSLLEGNTSHLATLMVSSRHGTSGWYKRFARSILEMLFVLVLTSTRQVNNCWSHAQTPKLKWST
jgi:hypothetical protein